ncbi:hypothetical protein SNARM312S_05253 [Streptomyces narbonensis]
MQQPVGGGGGARLRLGGRLRQVQAEPVIEQDRAAVGRRQFEERAEQRPPVRLGRRGVGVLVGAPEPVPGEGVLVRGRPHPAHRVRVDGDLGPVLPGVVEGVLDGLAGEPAAAREQIGLVNEAGRGVRVQRVEGLRRGEARYGGRPRGIRCHPLPVRRLGGSGFQALRRLRAPLRAGPEAMAGAGAGALGGVGGPLGGGLGPDVGGHGSEPWRREGAVWGTGAGWGAGLAGTGCVAAGSAGTDSAGSSALRASGLRASDPWCFGPLRFGPLRFGPLLRPFAPVLRPSALRRSPPRRAASGGFARSAGARLHRLRPWGSPPGRSRSPRRPGDRRLDQLPVRGRPRRRRCTRPRGSGSSPTACATWSARTRCPGCPRPCVVPLSVAVLPVWLLHRAARDTLDRVTTVTGRAPPRAARWPRWRGDI